MAKELILAKYGEMALKGLNRGTFEDILMKNLRRRLKKFGAFKLNRAQSTIYMEPLSDTIDLDEVLEQLQCVFGIAALCRACVCEKTMEDISAKAVSYLEEVLQGANTFKVEAKRADKAFPLKSPEICAELGGILLDAYPHLSVDVHLFTGQTSRVQAVCRSAAAARHFCSCPAALTARWQAIAWHAVAYIFPPFTMSARLIPPTVRRKRWNSSARN